MVPEDGAVTVVGAGVGGATEADGVTEVEADDRPDVPTLLDAVAVNEYAVPLESPVTVQEVPVVEQVRPPGEEVTVYSVGAPPEPGFTLTTAEPSPATTDVIDGVPGATTPVVGTSPPEAADATDVPALFVAVTVNE